MRSTKKKQSSKMKLVKPYPVIETRAEAISPAFQEKIDKLNKMLENMVFLKRT